MDGPLCIALHCSDLDERTRDSGRSSLHVSQHSSLATLRHDGLSRLGCDGYDRSALSR